jgi:hypothetical protein
VVTNSGDIINHDRAVSQMTFRMVAEVNERFHKLGEEEVGRTRETRALVESARAATVPHDRWRVVVAH